MRADVADGRARGELRPVGGRGARRRLPALPGACDRGRVDQGRRADDADARERAPPPAEAQHRRVPRPVTRLRRGRAGAARADPAQALRRRGRAARGRRPLQRQRLPAHRRRHRQEPRRAEREHRPALGHVRRAGRDRRLGAVLVPVPREPRLRPSPCGSSGAATSSTSSTKASRTGTRRSRTRVASSRRSPGSSRSRGTSRASGGASCALRAASRPRARRSSPASAPRPR